MTPPTILPEPDALTQPFWDGTREQRLLIQRCASCGQYQHPPQPSCSWCGSPDLAFAEVSGRGRVHSHTTTLRRAREQDAAFDTVLVVELAEQAGVLLVSRVPGSGHRWVRSGARVRVRFDPVEGSDLRLPQFDPEEDTDDR